jgi:hypothetical protein
LAIERHENSKIRSELSDAWKRIEELLNEARDNHASLAELDDTIRRSVISPKGLIRLLL